MRVIQRTTNPTRLIQIVVGLLLTLGGANLSLGTLGERYTGFGPLIGREVFWWALVVIVLLFVVFAERLPLSSIGFKRLSWGTLWAIPAGAALFIGIPLIHFCRLSAAPSAHELY